MAAARETLSPIINCRRASLEICQKLLSPLSPTFLTCSPSKNKDCSSPKFLLCKDVPKTPPNSPINQLLSSAPTCNFAKLNLRRGSEPISPSKFDLTNLSTQSTVTTSPRRRHTFATIHLPVSVPQIKVHYATCPSSPVGNRQLVFVSLEDLQRTSSSQTLHHSSASDNTSSVEEREQEVNMNDSNLLNFLHTNYNLQLQLDIVLGRGGFGDVLGGLYHSKPVAVKVINLRTKQHANSFTAERNALLLPLHPHVTKTLDMLQIGQQYGLVIMERLYQRNLLGYLHDTRYDLDLLTRVNEI